MKLYKVKLRAAVPAAILLMLAGCGAFQRPSELECMKRAMYFESNRSSRDGMVAVGGVVMNRVQLDAYPGTVCGIVAQKGQFAPGIMSRSMESRSAPLVRKAAVSVLRGERHPLIGNAQFFHTAGYRASYDNMHYVLVTGGNGFYERWKRELVIQPSPPSPLEGIYGTVVSRKATHFLTAGCNALCPQWSFFLELRYCCERTSAKPAARLHVDHHERPHPLRRSRRLDQSAGCELGALALWEREQFFNANIFFMRLSTSRAPLRISLQEP